jgi:hypothetical protein
LWATISLEERREAGRREELARTLGVFEDLK